ncbi:hypothetical protein PNOK_0973400 [Pyrrhoderma noxium]|uniref:CAP-Gly domain-containing protein n=1 Tax=Pyrrhoderma noxium TaxID=2282107 RepID=A0A286U4Y8_9AGAM|nr:hypothetical protein PNOK_0973400 [Pyrrhoderma noxium]
MMHGLFHAFLEFTKYERITGGKWGNGCRCRQCARRAPRVFQFSVRPDVQNVYLDRGARRALIGLFGEGWVMSEFAELPQKTRDGLLSGVKKRCLPMNVLLMLFAAHSGLKKLSSVRDAWGDTVKDMILTARSFVDCALCSEAEKVFNEKDLFDIMENDGMGRFLDGERVEWVMDSIRRGMNDNNVVKLYQALVSAVLLRSHPQESDKSLLSITSQIRVQVEQTRLDILRMIRRRWVSIRQEGGFDNMETCVTAEISDEINVPAEDLTTPSGTNPRGPMTRTGLQPTLSRVEDVTERDSMSTNHSLLLLAALHPQRVVLRLGATERERKESRLDSKFVPFGGRSISPTVNRAPSVNSTHSAMDVDDEDTPSNSGHVSTVTSPTLSSARRASITKGHRPRISTSNIKDTSDTASVLSVHERNVVTVQRPKSTASVTSTRSQASTTRRNTANTVPSSTTQQTLRPPSPVHSSFSLSNASLSSPKDDSTSGFRTPRDSMTSRDSIGRSRKIPTASTTSNVSMGSTGTSRSPRIVTAPSLPKAPVRSRRLSEASVSSTTTAGAARNRRISTTSTTTTATTAAGQKKTMIHKSPSATSFRTTNSSAGSAARKSVVAPGMAKSASADDRKLPVTAANANGSPNKPLPKSPSKENIDPERVGNTDISNKTIKSKSRVEAIMKEDKRNAQSPSSDSGSTATRATVRRKGSNDTITLSKKKKAASSTAGKAKTGSSSTPSEESTPVTAPVVQPKGATLDIGIPCLIFSKRKRFRAFARYIGEVKGETGPWVVTGDGWDDRQQLDGRAWHDGCWGGVKYFEVE